MTHNSIQAVAIDIFAANGNGIFTTDIVIHDGQEIIETHTVSNDWFEFLEKCSDLEFRLDTTVVLGEECPEEVPIINKLIGHKKYEEDDTIIQRA